MIAGLRQRLAGRRADEGGMAGRAEPNHLVVLVHGFMGSEGDFTNFKAHLKQDRALGGSLRVLAINRNTSTFDGVRAGAQRAMLQVQETIDEHKDSLEVVSVIGHSLGGIYARYLLHLMNEAGVFDKLEPCVFATFATPHLGVKRPPTTPINWVFNVLCLRWFQTTRELGMLDRGEDGKPLLYTMATDEAFLGPLRRFKRRSLYANVEHDFQVPYPTASIRHKSPYKTKGAPPAPPAGGESASSNPASKGPAPKLILTKVLAPCASTPETTASRNFSGAHPNITAWSLENMERRRQWHSARFVEHGVVLAVGAKNEPRSTPGTIAPCPESLQRAYRRAPRKELLREMLFKLDVEVGDWERYDVLFGGMLAHEQIINKRASLPGKAVVVHLIRHVLLPAHREVLGSPQAPGGSGPEDAASVVEAPLSPTAAAAAAAPSSVKAVPPPSPAAAAPLFTAEASS